MLLVGSCRLYGDFEPLPFTAPAVDTYNDIPSQTTSAVCGTKLL